MLKYNKHSFLLLGVNGLREAYDVRMFESQQKANLRVDHFDYLLLAEKVFLFDLVQPEDLDSLCSLIPYVVFVIGFAELDDTVRSSAE